MRIAVVSDIHGNLTAFEAVLADLRETAPDLVLQGGDLADAGSSPVEVVDRVRDLGWPGVVGNTDELLFRPESLTEFASESPRMQPLVPIIERMAAWTRDALGSDRIAWLRELPLVQIHAPIAVVHASPGDPWRCPNADGDLEKTYAVLGQAMVVYGHIHTPFVQRLAAMTVANSGSVGLPYDGDTRASYLLIDDAGPQIRRVEYDVAREQKALESSGLPHAGWVARMLETARPRMP